MPSWRLALAEFGARLFGKPHLRRVTEPAKLRRHFDRAARHLFPKPPFLKQNHAVSGDIPVTWLSVGDPVPGRVLIYVPGGAFVSAGAQTHAGLAAYIARELRAEAMIPAYRLAPEHPFPAGIVDVVAAYRGLLDKGYSAANIVMAGDSAGGGILLSALVRMLEQGITPPAALATISPAVDMRFIAPSLETNAGSDAILVSGRFDFLRQLYLAGHDPQDPLASPVLADFTGAPPLLVQLSAREILFDDGAAMVAAFKAAGAEARLSVFDTALHVFQILGPKTPEGRRAISEIAEFLARHAGWTK